MFRPALILLLLLFTLPAFAKQAKVESQAAYYHRAFTAVADNNAAQVESFAQHGGDPVLNKVLRGYAMALPGNDYSFEELNGFIANNPAWPGLRGIQMIAEQKLPGAAPPAQIAAWFKARPPISLAGFYRSIDALNQTGQTQAAQDAITARWINNDFSGDEQTSYYSRFSNLLDNDAMWSRMDRLLWKNDIAEAERMMPYVNASDKAVAEARLAFASQSGNAENIMMRVPSDARDDSGLLYQRLRWRVKNNRDDEADDILLHAPSDLGDGEAWWDQRQIMVRRAIAQRDYNLAYRLAANHGQTKSKTLTQGEFLAGWLALRFLDRPDDARQHFQSLYDNATTPVTRARGAYWLGRCYEVLGDKASAEQSYEDAAVFNTTFYGQLATTRLYAAPVLTAKNDPPLPANIRNAFMARDNIRAILRLNEIGERDRAQTFFHAASEAAAQRAEFIMLAETATRIGRPDLGISAVKAANQKNMIVENGAFPVLTIHAPSPPEPAFTHALIRQESMFNVGASSGVGARGLMQLMPGTARDTARKEGMRYSESALNDPAYNLKLGTSFVQEQIDHFNGSYILALAGYNAGPGRVREWINQYGDPRTGDIDPIDWIELIPIQETRNYVQRIIESLQMYRAKLAGGQSNLLIINDLKR